MLFRRRLTKPALYAGLLVATFAFVCNDATADESIARSIEAEGMLDSVDLESDCQLPFACDIPNLGPVLDATALRPERLDQFSLFAAIDGSKQPQDYGVNADLGVQLRAQYSAPLLEQYGIGYQIGSSVIVTDNAVRVFELVGENTNRNQSFTTAGLFQRVGRFGWGGVFDYLYQDGFDQSSLGQFRGQVAYNITSDTQLGLTGRLRAFDDSVSFLGNQVTLQSINQGTIFFRHFFETGVQSTVWFGLVDEHGESNAAFGAVAARYNDVVVGADIVAPLNDSLAIYGETNLITPADSGTVDAFLGLIWYPFNNAKFAHRTRFSPFLPNAAPTSFSVDLRP